MNNDKRQRVSLCIHSSVLSTKEITRRLGIEPTSYLNIGEPFSKRNPKSKLREETFWELKSGLDTYVSLVKQIQAILTMLEEHDVSFHEIRRYCYIEFSCGLFSENEKSTFELDHKILQAISQTGANLSLDFYPPDDYISE